MKNIDKKQLEAIQALVNDKIRQNLPVMSRENVHYQDAVDEGAIALFGEKYGDSVRVMTIGTPSVSVELCGGTHVSNTGEIGTFIIVSEGSIGTGLRRIEAVTGREAEKFIMQNFELLNMVAKDVKSTAEEAPQKVKGLLNELSAERKRLADMERKLSKNVADDLIGQKKDIDGIPVIAAKVQSSSIPILREIGDEVRAKVEEAVIILGSVYDEKPGFISMVTPGLVDKGLHAGKIVQQIAGITGGGGGGKADIAQAGGKDKNKIDEALTQVPDIIRKAL
jgi:alanyl-tRNA synthetase